jgi:2-C-methyl-D-erythritol 4-phosphate cytidylyltransferase
MESGVPKQFLLLKGKPILHYSLEAFYHHDSNTTLLLVLAKTEMDRWKQLCQQYPLALPHQVVEGGSTRTQSVKNGLALVPQDSLVAIHDGARPFVSTDIIEACYQSAALFGSGVASVKPKDSIRQVSEQSNTALDREQLRLIQTPQTFQSSLIKSAFEQFGNAPSSDDATILEKAGHSVHLVEGSYRNFKVTTPEDLVLAEALMR